MGRRSNRRRPTREEKMRRDEHRTPNVQHRTSNEKDRTEKTERERRRTVSPETLALAQAYARVMNWPMERILPHADNMEA